MTDITELAQREKFEAWLSDKPFHARYMHWSNTLNAYDYTGIQLAWEAYQAGGAELIEALEKAQTISAAAEKLVRCKGRYHSEQNYRALAALFGVKTPDLPPLEHENVHYVDAAEMEIEALRQRIAELESRTVKLPKLKMLEDYLAEVAIEERKQILVGVKLEFHRACVAAGIKVEAE
jgi:hypothetical protein